MIALATVFWIGVNVKERLTAKPARPGNGLSVHSNLLAAVAALAAAVDLMSQDVSKIVDNQGAICARLKIMPTREEIKDIAADDRNMMRHEFQKVLAGVGEIQQRLAKT